MKNLLLAIAVFGSSLPESARAQEAALGTVTGTVRLNAAVRPPKNIALCPQCAEIVGGPLKSEETVVDANGNLKWCFVWISKGLEGKEFRVPQEKVVLDQVGCGYTPHVFGIRAGQTLLIRNSDPVLHNVHGLPFTNNEWNFAQPQKGQENEVKLQKAETMIKIKCDIHTWMGTWAGVLDHPFFAVTDEAGRYSIRGLPPGKYTLSFWQEAWTIQAEKGPQEEIELKPGETRTVDFAFDKRKG